MKSQLCIQVCTVNRTKVSHVGFCQFLLIGSPSKSGICWNNVEKRERERERKREKAIVKSTLMKIQ